MKITKMLTEYNVQISYEDEHHNVDPINDSLLSTNCVVLDTLNNFKHNVHEVQLYKRNSGPLKNQYYYIFKQLSGQGIGMFSRQDFESLKEELKSINLQLNDDIDIFQEFEDDFPWLSLIRLNSNTNQQLCLIKKITLLYIEPNSRYND